MTTLRAIAEVTAALGMIQILELAVLTIRLTSQQVASAARVVEVSSRLQVVDQKEAAQGALALVQMTTVHSTPVATTAPGMMSTHKDVACMMTTTLLPLSNAAPVEAVWPVEEENA